MKIDVPQMDIKKAVKKTVEGATKVTKTATSGAGKLSTAMKDTAAKLNNHKPKFVDEFKAFLQKYGILALAIGFIMGGAAQKLVSALVQDIIMPIIAVITPAGDWQKITIDVWRFHFAIGAFLGAVLDFLIIAFVIFWIVKLLMKEETKK